MALDQAALPAAAHLVPERQPHRLVGRSAAVRGATRGGAREAGGAPLAARSPPSADALAPRRRRHHAVVPRAAQRARSRLVGRARATRPAQPRPLQRDVHGRAPHPPRRRRPAAKPVARRRRPPVARRAAAGTQADGRRARARAPAVDPAARSLVGRGHGVLDVYTDVEQHCPACSQLTWIVEDVVPCTWCFAIGRGTCA
mmetsp:Transcript_36216/g.106024  ORF Transcript_36216/g.106024 Transcript_36216/m.106024 type:complete len:200 (-) Transcript_36216:126-725(-)